MSDSSRVSLLFQRTLTIALPALVLLSFLLPLRHGFTDDGFIHIRYAQNLITTGTYSFNPREVSFGTTSPLWVAMLAAIGYVLGSGEILVSVSRALSWLAAFAAVGAAHKLARMMGAGRVAAIAAAAVLAGDAWFARWSALGMETSLAVFAILAMGAASTRAYDDRRAAGLFGFFIAIAALVRPEVYLALPVFFVAALWSRTRLRCVVITTAFASALLVPWLLFAKFHIGSFLPNTAGAKSGGMILDPVTFVNKFAPIAKIVASSQGIAVLSLLVSVAVLGRHARLNRKVRFMALWVIALPVAYVVFDIQVLSRYVLLVTPIVAVAGVAALDHLPLPVVRRRVVVIAAASLSIFLNAGFYTRVVLPASIAFSDDLTHELKDLAIYLRDNSPPDAVVAAADIGYLSFYSGRRILDLGGLVEPEMLARREVHTYETIMDRALYFDVPGYPHVDYVVDRVTVPPRFDDVLLSGHRFERVYLATVRNLGIRKPGPYYYALYRTTPATP